MPIKCWGSDMANRSARRCIQVGRLRPSPQAEKKCDSPNSAQKFFDREKHVYDHIVTQCLEKFMTTLFE
jgi:hypothetical protein